MHTILASRPEIRGQLTRSVKMPPTCFFRIKVQICWSGADEGDDADAEDDVQEDMEKLASLLVERVRELRGRIVCVCV